MTGVQLTASLADLGLSDAFDDVATAAGDMTDLMDNIGSVLINGARERIGVTNVSPDGVAWPQSLRARGIGQAARPSDDFVGPMPSGAGGPTLRDSGGLMASITSEAAPDHVKVGSNLIYAGVHQTGATITAKNGKGLSFTLANGEQVVVGSVTIPARPYLGISEDERAQIEDVTIAHFNSLLGGGR